mgnify:CR=1 FL=1|tara:strand:+ start:162 stop:443 length:282 start_codon:yes stop_codon:yes gene_type:complete
MIEPVSWKDLFDSATPPKPHPNQVRGIGDVVQMVSEFGERLPDIGVVVEQSANDWAMWRVEWTNSDRNYDGWAIGDMYDSWVDEGDLWRLIKK